MLGRARSLIYVEDQYFWSEEIARSTRRRSRRAPELRIIVVVPRHPDRNGRISGPTNRLGQLTMMKHLAEAGGDRVAVYDLENEQGAAIYVHAKVVVIDDVLAMIGSDNMNRRSWTHDSELSIAVLDEQEDVREPRDPAGLGDGARRFARDLRLRLWREHLGATSDDGLVGPARGFERWRERLTRSMPGTRPASVATDPPAASGTTGLDRSHPGNARGRGRSIARSSTRTAVPVISAAITGSDRRPLIETP